MVRHFALLALTLPVFAATTPVIVDHDGATTFLSARNALRIARERNFKSVFVVSQYFHVPRTRLALQRFGVPAVYSAHAHYFELRDLYSAPREFAGYVSYLLRSYDAGAALTGKDSSGS